jgi:hypothetical protein
MEYLTIYLKYDDKYLVIESDTPRVSYNSDKCVYVHCGPDRDYNSFILGRSGSRKEVQYPPKKLRHLQNLMRYCLKTIAAVQIVLYMFFRGCISSQTAGFCRKFFL